MRVHWITQTLLLFLPFMAFLVQIVLYINSASCWLQSIFALQVVFIQFILVCCLVLYVWWVQSLQVSAGLQVQTPTVYQNHAYRDVYAEISSSRMFSRYTVDLHGHRKFKYLFISLATMCYTCSQLQNCPVETRQHRHIQCKSFPSWPPGVDSCC